MEVRDAIESDAEALAEIADAPVDVMRNLVHDRTVRVAERDQSGSDPHADAGGDETAALVGFVSFDARERTVHVTQFGGTVEACERLLGEPVRFAVNEGMSVELLVAEDDAERREAAERAGFERTGRGPRFGELPTVRYRLDSSAGGRGRGSDATPGE